MINYPDGRKNLIAKSKTLVSNKNASNRGKALEDNINRSNTFYMVNSIALITKRPTPIRVVKVDYSNNARITDAFFEKQSTTDYNGVYNGRYIDFEAKSCQSKTSFPIANIPSHQLKHLQLVNDNKGIAFFIIAFSKLNEIYLLPAEVVIFIANSGKKSIPLELIREKGIRIKEGTNPPIKYLDAVNLIYF